MSIVRRAVRTSMNNSQWYLQQQRQHRENQKNAKEHKGTGQDN